VTSAMASPSCPGLLVYEAKETIEKLLGHAIWGHTTIRLTLLDDHAVQDVTFKVEFVDIDDDGQLIVGRTEDGKTVNLHLHRSQDESYIIFV
jgi:hypothetical protein